MSGKIPPLHHRRVLAACLTLAAILLSPLPPSAGAVWDIGATVGYAAAVFAVILYLYPLRGRDLRGSALPHRRLLTVTQHRRCGWIALGLATAHALITLVAQPLTVQYLLPTAPIYMLCGSGALLALAILVPTGLATRSRMRLAPQRSLVGVSHSAIAALLLALLGAHLIGSGQLLDTVPKAIVASVLLALPLFWTALRTRTDRTRTGHWVAPAVTLAAGALLLVLPTPTATAWLLEPGARRNEALPLHFPHELHTTVNCVLCHHNFRDATGTANCIDCHRSARADLVRSSEATFHIFCRQCHHDRAVAGERHGPTRTCEPCHH